MATQVYTDAVTLTAAAEFNNFDSVAYAVLSGVAGTNTVTATGPANYTYAATRPPVWFIPANTNTGATTLNVTASGGSALGAKSVFWNGAACVGGELRQNVPCAVIYDGTQFHIIANGFNAPFSDAHAVVEGSADATKKIRFEVDGLTTATTRVITAPDNDLTLGGVLNAEVATTSGTSVEISAAIPTWAKSLTLMFSGVSTNGTDNLIVQVGDTDGYETSGYVSVSESGATIASSTAGFLATGVMGATEVLNGQMTLNLQKASTFTWTCSGILVDAAATANLNSFAGIKSTSAALDRIRITTTGGTDAFDAGAISLRWSA